MILGVTRARIAVTIPRSLLANARRAVREGTAGSVSAYVTAAMEDKAKVDDLKAMLDEMLAETGGPVTPTEKRQAEQMLGLRPRRSKRRAA